MLDAMPNQFLKRVAISVSLAITSFYAVGQQVEVMKTNAAAEKDSKADAFDCIDEYHVLDSQTYIASLRGSITNSGKSTVWNLFKMFWKKSNELGANAFLVKQVVRDPDTLYVNIEVYNISDAEIQENFKLYPENMVYVFGGVNKNGKIQKVKLNDEKVMLAPLEYIAYQNQEGQQVSVGVGGLLGAKIWTVGEHRRPPKHLMIGGFRLEPGMDYQVDVGFSTGSLEALDMNFGQFLVRVFLESP